MSPKKKAKEKAKKKEVAPHSEAGVGGAAQPVDGAVEASPAWERGTVVQRFGLAGRPELNETARVVVQFDEPRGRYAVIVELLDSKPILIKPSNLRPWPPAESAGVSAAVEPAALPPLTLNVSGEGSLVDPRRALEVVPRDLRLPCCDRNVFLSRAIDYTDSHSCRALQSGSL